MSEDMLDSLKGVKTGSLESVNAEQIEDALKTGDYLIPMSAFKQFNKTNVFVVEDEEFEFMKEFFLVDLKSDPIKMYCKWSTGERFLKENPPKKAKKQNE